MESREQQGELESMLLGSCMTPSLPPGSLCSWASVQTRGWLRTEVGWQLLAEVLITQLFIPLSAGDGVWRALTGQCKDSHTWHAAPKVYPQTSSRNFLVLHLPILLLPGPWQISQPLTTAQESALTLSSVWQRVIESPLEVSLPVPFRATLERGHSVSAVLSGLIATTELTHLWSIRGSFSTLSAGHREHLLPV